MSDARITPPLAPPKLADKLSFDEELDLKPYMAEGEEGEAAESVYKLHAVLIHLGDADHGHYYAYVRPQLGSPGGGPWLCFDDSDVAEVPARQVFNDAFGGRVGAGGMSRNAYLLQYVRRDAVPSLLHAGDAGLPDDPSKLCEEGSK